ncbi:MAG: hypothetical protein AAFN81_17310 [Bacteroidota bacterium]
MIPSRWLFFAFVIITWSCQVTKPAIITPQRTLKSIQLDSLAVEDLSEDMSRLSTQVDEIFLLAFWHNDSLIHAFRQSPMLEFSKANPVHPLSMPFTATSSNDRLSCFLIELDEEQLSGQVGELCSQALFAPNFPQQFNQERLDSLIGDDDLLGMQSIRPSAIEAPQRLTFRGRQLFDPFVYRLYWSVAKE